MMLARIAVAQQQDIIAYDDNQCKKTSFCLDCGTPRAKMKGDILVNDYFLAKLDKNAIEELYASILIQLLVDKNGKVCTREITFRSPVNTEEQIKALHLEKIVNEMPDWSPAVEDGKPECSIVLLRILAHANGYDFNVDYYRVNTKDMNIQTGKKD